MIDVLLALFILWILVFIIGMIRKGLVWSFLDLIILLAMFYEGASIVLVVIMLLINSLTIIYILKGDDTLE